MFKVSNKNVIDVILVFLLLTLNICHTFFSVSVIYFEQANVSWVFRKQSSLFLDTAILTKRFYNQFHNILRLFDILSNFPFTTSETMGD